MILFTIYIVVLYLVGLISSIIYILHNNVKFDDLETPVIVLFWMISPLIIPLFLPIIIAGLIKIMSKHKNAIGKYIIKKLSGAE